MLRTIFLAGLLLQMTARAEPPQSAPVRRVAGLLSEQGDKRCLGDWSVEWVNRHHEVGFLRVAGSDVPLEPLRGRPVVVTGRVVADFVLPPVTHTGECPIPQMRSDWVEGLHGMRVRRTGGAGVPFIHVTAAQPLTDLAARMQGQDTIALTYTNRQLGSDLELRIHYEGCYGKPGSMLLERKLSAVPQGGTATVTFPAIQERHYDGARKGIERGRSEHVAVSVEVVSTSTPGLLLDCDLPIRALGAEPECRRRR